jgi:hypothetical protein
MDVWNVFAAAKGLQAEVVTELGPPPEGLRSAQNLVVPMTLVRGTRGYIERIANQVNGAYENGWYDACAVMIRRLLETLIIEAFEKHQIANKIKNTSGDFLYLRDLVSKTLDEASWNLTRNCKQALPRIKDIGDRSAHSRRYNAVRGDLAPLLSDIRLVVQEFLYLANLK